MAGEPGRSRRVHRRRLHRRPCSPNRDLPGRDGSAGTVRPINRDGQVNFGVACRDCPLRERCTRSRTGKTMRIGEHDALQRAHRRHATDPAWVADYRRHRPMVERTLAWLTRGNRKLRYRGTVKNDAWFHLRAGAVNLRRLLALGLHRGTGGWQIA